MDGSEGRVEAGKRGLRFEPCGQCAAKRDAPDSGSFSGTRLSRARLSGGQPLHEPRSRQSSWNRIRAE